MDNKTEYIISLKDLFTDKVNNAERAAAGLESRAGSLQGTIAKIGATIGLAAMAKGIFDAGTNMESLNVSLKTMLGSKEEADKLVAQMVEFASTTPFQQSEVQTAGKQLLAYGIEAKNIIPTLRQLGDVSAGLGQPIGEIAYLYGTIKTQGKAMTVDIKQFANRGIPIYEELAKVTGKSGAALQKYIEDGKIGFPQIQKAFENMSGAGGKFAGLTGELAKTTGGQWSNMKDTIEQLAVTIFKELQPAINWFIKAMVSAVGVVKNIISFIKEHKSVLKALALAIGTVVTAIFLYNKYLAISAAISRAYATFQAVQMVASLTGATTAQLALNVAMEMNPIGLVIMALAGLVAAISLVIDHYNMLTDTYEKVGADFKNQKVAEETKRVNELADAYKKAGYSKYAAEKMALDAENMAIDATIKKLALQYQEAQLQLQILTNKMAGAGPLGLIYKSEVDEQLKNVLALKEAMGAAVGQKSVLKSTVFSTAQSAGKGIADAKIDTGTDKVKANTHNVITINIDKLIEKFTITTNTVGESAGSIKEQVVKAMIEAVNDSQIIAGI